MVESTLSPNKRRTRRDVKRGLQAKGIKQAEVARMAGVSTSMVSHWLKGRATSSRLQALTDRLLSGAA